MHKVNLKNTGEMTKMAGRAQSRFITRMHNRMIDRSDAHERGKNEYGVECIYCEKYFANIRKPKFGGYVCKDCRPF